MTDMRWWETRRFAFFAMIVAALPLVWPHTPPLTDLPGHMARYRVMLGDEAGLLDAYYAFEWRMVGNLGVDLLVAALAPWIGLEPAVKTIVIAIPVLTTGALLWISRELHGRVSPFALFALPLAYNYPLHFGFVNFCLAMALAFAGWALWLRLGRIGKLRLRAGLFLVIGLIVWTAHAMGWGMLCLFVFAGEWAAARASGQRLVAATLDAAIACLPLAPPLLALVAWRSGGDAAATERFFDLAAKLQGLGSVLRDRWIGWDMASLLLLSILIYAGARGRIGRMHPAAAAAAGLAAAAFMLLPFTLMGSAYADLRLLPYAMMIALVGIAPFEDGRTKVETIALVALAFFLLRTAGIGASFAVYDRDWSRELAALDRLPRGARVLALVGEPCGDGWAYSRQTHLPAFATVRRAAFANDQWRMEGAPLLSVRVQHLGYFAHDPSQISVAAPCPHIPNLMPQQRAMAAFPRNVFTHVWLIRPHSRAPHSGLTPVWSNGDSTLYAVDRDPSRLPLGAAAQ